MLLSFNWLKEYLNLPDSTTADEVGAKLKAATVEVESINNLGKDLGGIVVGKVLSAEKHPNADKLKLCQVDVGNEKLQIVCGGSNVVEGMLVALAKVGAKVRWHGEGDLIELVPTAIRGVESFGMICAASEIGLDNMFPAKDEKEILDLTQYNFKPGENLVVALDLADAVFEVDNKSLSNRPDLWGHYGMAREVAVLTNKELSDYKVTDIKESKDLSIKVKIADKNLCPRYMAVAMSGVLVAPSPDWLKKKLAAVGLNSVNNIVDITNYVMLDLGQPLHAFDADLVTGKKGAKEIFVRLADKEERVKALDGNEYVLSENDLVIADNSQVLAVAGVIGGEGSAISEKTTNIIFESANFLATSIRKTSTRLGVRTDSAQRFEKSLDPNLCELAIKKAVELAKQVCPDVVVSSSLVDETSFSLPVGPIEVTKDFFEKKIGVAVPEKDIVKILEKLGFELKDKKDSWAVKIPTWRATKDVSLAEDLVEEIVRIYGYDHVPSSLPSFLIVPPETNKLRQLEWRVADVLVREFAYTESYNYAFVSGEQLKNLSEDVASYIELDNPLAKDRPYLRRNLLLNLLSNVANNIGQQSEIKIFETGKVFCADQPGVRSATNGDELLPRQDVWFTALYVNKKDHNPFWEVKRILGVVGQELKLDWTIAGVSSTTWEHPTRTTIINIADQAVGSVGEVSVEVAKKFGIDYRVGFVQLNLSSIQELNAFKDFTYQPSPIFPAVERDVAFLVDKKINHSEIVEELSKIDVLIKKVELFDVYLGDKIAAGKKSMAYRVTYIDPARTLTGGEVDQVHAKVLNVLQKKFGAEIR